MSRRFSVLMKCCSMPFLVVLKALISWGSFNSTIVSDIINDTMIGALNNWLNVMPDKPPGNVKIEQLIQGFKKPSRL